MDVKLVMFGQDGQRKEFPITSKTATLGRGEDCTLRVPLLNVSRRHCELIKGDAELLVRDLASSNGTYVNNRRINEAVLKAGDRLSLGPVIFTVQIDGRPEQITPIKTKTTKAAEVTQTEDEEIVDLEADLAGADESDPIAALEALAAEHEEKRDQEK